MRKYLLVSVIPQCLCCISCTSPVLGALKYLSRPCSLHGRENRSFGAPPVISQGPPFFIFWMDCVEEENNGNLCFSVECSNFMMQKRDFSYALWNFRILARILLDLVGGRRGALVYCLQMLDLFESMCCKHHVYSKVMGAWYSGGFKKWKEYPSS